MRLAARWGRSPCKRRAAAPPQSNAACGSCKCSTTPLNPPSVRLLCSALAFIQHMPALCLACPTQHPYPCSRRAPCRCAACHHDQPHIATPLSPSYDHLLSVPQAPAPLPCRMAPTRPSLPRCTTPSFSLRARPSLHCIAFLATFAHAPSPPIPADSSHHSAKSLFGRQAGGQAARQAKQTSSQMRYRCRSMPLQAAADAASSHTTFLHNLHDMRSKINSNMRAPAA